MYLSIFVTFWFKRLGLASIKSRVKCVEVIGVKLILNNTKPFTETLKMNNFSCPQEAYGRAYLFIMNESEHVVVGRARFLLCYTFINTTLGKADKTSHIQILIVRGKLQDII